MLHDLVYGAAWWEISDLLSWLWGHPMLREDEDGRHLSGRGEGSCMHATSVNPGDLACLAEV